VRFNPAAIASQSAALLDKVLGVSGALKLPVDLAVTSYKVLPSKNLTRTLSSLETLLGLFG